MCEEDGGHLIFVMLLHVIPPCEVAMCGWKCQCAKIATKVSFLEAGQLLKSNFWNSMLMLVLKKSSTNQVHTVRQLSKLSFLRAMCVLASFSLLGKRPRDVVKGVPLMFCKFTTTLQNAFTIISTPK